MKRLACLRLRLSPCRYSSPPPVRPNRPASSLSRVTPLWLSGSRLPRRSRPLRSSPSLPPTEDRSLENAPQRFSYFSQTQAWDGSQWLPTSTVSALAHSDNGDLVTYEIGPGGRSITASATAPAQQCIRSFPNCTPAGTVQLNASWLTTGQGGRPEGSRATTSPIGTARSAISISGQAEGLRLMLQRRPRSMESLRQKTSSSRRSRTSRR